MATSQDVQVDVEPTIGVVPQQERRLDFGSIRVILRYKEDGTTPYFLQFYQQEGSDTYLYPPPNNPDLLEEVFNSLSACTYS